MSSPPSAPLLLPREAVPVALGVAALVAGLLAGHDTPSYSHAAEVEKAELEVAKNVHELLPDSFRIEASIKKTGLTLLQSEDILLLGGDPADAGCSGGALYLFWEDGAIGFGCQCNGPTSAGCPHAGAACSEPAVQGPSKFQPNVEYKVVAEYSRKTEEATVSVDGQPYFSKHVRWNPPRSGPVTLLAGSHASADTEPFLGEARSIAVYPVPAGSWGWEMIGALGALLGLYIGLGAAIGRRTYQLSSSSLLESHPHAAQWSSLRALVADGADWARRGGGGAKRRQDYSALSEAANGDTAVSPGGDGSKQRKERHRERQQKAEQHVAADADPAGRAEPVQDAAAANDAAAARQQQQQQQGGAWVPPKASLLSSGARETGAKVQY